MGFPSLPFHGAITNGDTTEKAESPTEVENWSFGSCLSNLLPYTCTWFLRVSEKQKGMEKLGVGGGKMGWMIPVRKKIKCHQAHLHLPMPWFSGPWGNSWIYSAERIQKEQFANKDLSTSVPKHCVLRECPWVPNCWKQWWVYMKVHYTVLSASYRVEICPNVKFQKEQLQANQILVHCYLKWPRRGKSEIYGF